MVTAFTSLVVHARRCEKHTLTGLPLRRAIAAVRSPKPLPRYRGLWPLRFAKPRPGGNSAYIQHIKETGHGSVLEHAVWSLIFTDVSRSLTHELVRHRAGVGYSQLRQRYVDESVAEFVVPHDLAAEVRMAVGYLYRYFWSHSIPSENGPAGLTVDQVSEALDVIGNEPDVIAGLVWLRSCLTTNADYRYLSDHLSHKIAKQTASDNTMLRREILMRGCNRLVSRLVIQSTEV